MRVYNHFFYFLVSRLFNENKINFFKKYITPELNNSNFSHSKILKKFHSYLDAFNTNAYVNNKNTINFKKNISNIIYNDNIKMIVFLLRSFIKNLNNIKKNYSLLDIKNIFLISNCLRTLYNRELSIGFSGISSEHNANNSFPKSNILKSYISSKAREYSLIFKNSYSIFMYFVNTFKSSVIDGILLNSFSSYRNFTVFFDMKNRNTFYEVNPYQRDYYIKDIVEKNIITLYG